MTVPAMEALGEDVLLLRLGEDIDAATNARVHRAAALLDAARPAWVLDIVPAYATLAVFLDVAAMDDPGLPLAVAEAWVAGVLGQAGAPGHPGGGPAGSARRHRTLEVPVRFGDDDGPDLADVAASAGLSGEATVAAFCAPEYQVALLGFAPGFPYLIGLDPALAMPRLSVPRTQVPAGSVAIGGAQAGIYPREGPGGWRLLGRTSLGLFDPEREPPALLAPGDRVRFVVAR